MARKPASTSMGREEADGGDGPMPAPPSTLAAQLVRHQREPGGVATFHQLLNEIIASPEIVELDVLENYKLITVVAEAGLKASVAADPFSNSSNTPQLLASLDVIEVAFRRSPDVLFYAGPGTDGPGSQLCLQLLPRLFSLLAMPGQAVLAQRSYGLISFFCAKLTDSPPRWLELPRIIDLLQSSAEDVLLTLEHNVAAKIDKPVDLKLPSVDVVMRIGYQGEHPIATKSGHQVYIANALQAIKTVYASISACHRTKTSRMFVVPRLLRGFWSRTISIVGRLLRVLRTRNSTFDLPSPQHELAPCLKLINELSRSLDINHDCAFLRRRLDNMIVMATADLLTTNHWISWSEDDLIEAERILQLAADRTNLSSSMKLGLRTAVLPALKITLIHVRQTNTISGLLLSALSRLESSLVHLADMSAKGDIESAGSKSRTAFDGASASTDSLDDGNRPSKRQKRSHHSSSYDPSGGSEDYHLRLPVVMEEFCSLLGNWNPNDLSGLHQDAVALFTDLSSSQQKRLLHLLALLPCCMNKNPDNLIENREPQKAVCQFCKVERWRKRLPEAQWEALFQTLASLVTCPTIQASKELRVDMMFAIQRFSWHTPISKHLSLADKPNSQIAEWCLHGLRSSVRELRLAAAHTLPHFLQDRNDVESEFCRKNRVRVLQYLRELSNSKDPRFSEAIITALGQAGEASGDEEMELVLLQFTDFLGHTNPLVCNLAQLELRRLADSRGCTPDALFNPFWRTVAITAIKELPSRPQKIQQLADLLTISVNQLLMMTRVETLPFLVLWKRQDAILRLVQARSPDASPWSLCVSPKSLNAILSLIMVHHPDNPEVAIADCLTHASQDFAQDDITGLLKTQPAAIAFEILRLAGDAEGERREKAQRAFLELAVLVERKSQSSTRTSATQARVMSVFFENHALGIMTLISACIDDTSQPWLERKRCLRGLEQMIILGHSYLSPAVPQICACLQSVLEVSTLRNDAFSAWMCLVDHLENEEDLEGLTDQTFTIITQKWNDLSMESQQKAYDGVAKIIRDHQGLIHSMLDVLPSFGDIPLMSKFENQLSKFRGKMEITQRFAALSQRCNEESPSMVLQALRELLPYLDSHQQWIHDSIATEQPDPAISALVRSLLDICARFGRENDEIATIAAKCLGVIGCIDPNRLEVTRTDHDIIVLSNFTQAAECLDFVTFMLENVLVKAFHSAPTARAHSFLAWVMQELLTFSGFGSEAVNIYRPQGSQADEKHQKWMAMAESARSTLTPFLTSRYSLNMGTKTPEAKTYPIFSLTRTHGSWIRDFTHDLLQRGKGDNAKQIFSALARVVRFQDLSVASFLLPFAVANVIIGGTNDDATDIRTEILSVLNTSSVNELGPTEKEILKSCIESVFQVLDYLSRWLHEKRKRVSTAKSIAARSGKPIPEVEAATDESQIKSVESVLASIPAEVIASRSIEVQSLARALLHWEAHIRLRRGKVQPPAGAIDKEDQPLWNHLHKIYAKIDEPDGLEGIYTHLNILGPVERIQDHQKAGRWAAAESWYELELKEFPNSSSVHEDFLSCLSAAGKHHAVLDHTKSLSSELRNVPAILDLASQAAWNTEQWTDLQSLLHSSSVDPFASFNIGLGSAFDALKSHDLVRFESIMTDLRLIVARSMSAPVTASMQSCHGQLLKLQAMHEIEAIVGEKQPQTGQSNIQQLFRRRLDVLGSYITDKQYLLAIRRTAMRLADTGYEDMDIAAAWAVTAKLARKSNAKDVAYGAANNAFMLGDDYAIFEQARFLWNEGEHRKAITEVVSAIENHTSRQTRGGSGATSDTTTASIALTRSTAGQDHKSYKSNLLLAKAHLLHAKWLDRGGQTQSSVINQKYQLATRTYTQWEKGLYYLGKFYNKLLESEKSLPPSKQSFQYLSGETAKLVIENYLRSLMFGCKYISETMPRLLTLWLEFGNESERTVSKEVPDDMRNRAKDTKPKMMEIMNKQVKKYGEKVPTYLFYTALNQMLTRISHKNTAVYEILAGIIIRVIAAHPQQGLWPVLAVLKSSKGDRVHRGNYILSKLKECGKPLRHENNSLDVKQLILQGQKLADTLLHACNVPVDQRTAQVSLTRDLGFNAKVAPCALVVPVERALTASLPTGITEVPLKNYRAFPMSREAVTISSFSDDVLVLSSLQRPRKIVVRGSDGRKYGLLCKPKDDLRKDQRLMEFNAVINKSLKKDAESSKRRLYIRTYAVTPLNEECGIIEWVDGLKPMRDILLNLYRIKGVKVDYSLLRELLNEASDPNTKDGWRIFTETILPMYQPALHEWFTELFPSPDSWFNARLRYTRSCAVASMTGHVLGLGDRHGENVLLEESNGGVFHVDFNCLFDKGLTFEKPELVPFRLTHNMVDAFGAYGVDGPFRRSAECAMAVMRANQDALLTTLETFVYDPTADFVGGRKRPVKGVPETPKEVLESVQGKVEGLMRGDSVPLSVQGHVDALIKQATNPRNLCAMYIGWCAFL